MTQSPMQIIEEMHKLGRVKQKAYKIERYIANINSDSNISELKERLLTIQKLLSEALIECENN